MTSIAARPVQDALRFDPPTPVDATELMKSVAALELPAAYEPFIALYQTVGKRNVFLWRWVHQGLVLTTLPTVDPAHRDRVLLAKFLGVMFDVLLDDVADVRRDYAFLQQLIRIPFAPHRVDRSLVKPDDVAYLEVTEQVWAAIAAETEQLPRYAELADLWEFDYGQLLNCMRYAVVTMNDPRRINSTEHDLYQPHNMHMMINGTIDLMASPGFDLAEVGRLREVLWSGQMMGRIGNMMTTWQREIADGDLTSGVFCRALDAGALTPEDLVDPDKASVERRIIESQIEQGLFREWAKRRTQVAEHGQRLRSMSVQGLLDGLQRLFQMHLASRGLK
ncbi:MAG: hypothetical protein KC635_00035 [Myxococcales bacterium]|nr:hypothetical protein [Myxococcales bacterium]MCB9735809.1 hypothetical protein [Deltaproteobacteria bacterium]